MDQLRLSSERRGRYTVVKVSGELDICSADQLERHVSVARTVHGPHLVFDLSELAFIDSQGVRVLIGTMQRSHAQEGSVALAAVQPRVSRVLQVTGLKGRVPVFDTVEQALGWHRRTESTP